MRYLRIFFAILLFPCLVVAEEPLTNEDIIDLVSMGFSEGTQIAKVEQAETIAFDLSIGGLKALKEVGVPEAVIAAMLKRDSSADELESPDTRQGAPAPAISAEQLRWGSASPPVVELETDEGRIKLPYEVGYDSSVGFELVYSRTYINYPGIESPVRTKNRQPSFIVTSTDGRVPVIFIVKLDKDKDEGENGVRSLKMGGVAVIRGGPSAGSYRVPAKKWHFDWEGENLEDGIDRVVLKKPLKPGEYGIQLAIGGPDGGSLFSFAVE